MGRAIAADALARPRAVADAGLQYQSQLQADLLGVPRVRGRRQVLLLRRSTALLAAAPLPFLARDRWLRLPQRQWAEPTLATDTDTDTVSTETASTSTSFAAQFSELQLLGELQEHVPGLCRVPERRPVLLLCRAAAVQWAARLRRQAGAERMRMPSSPGRPRQTCPQSRCRVDDIVQ